MAEVQIPLHQKTISNRYPHKNLLEIRGYSGTSSNSIKFMDKTQANFKPNPISQIQIRYINQPDDLIMKGVDTLDDLDNDDDENVYIKKKRQINNSWNEESNEGWTSTGVLSDRSSVYSIDDADFDREASKKVNNQLKEIESILYEKNSSHRPILVECKEWLEKFPHLRVLGNQISNVPKEEGFSHVEAKHVLQKQQSVVSNKLLHEENTSRSARRNKESSETSSAANQGLLVHGSNIPVKSVELTDKNLEYKFLEEEIFEEEGNYEELFAYDNREDEYLLEHNKRLNINKRRRRNLPPVTPKAAMKDIVLNLLFDHIWSEIINWSSGTIKRYAKLISTGVNDSIEHSTPLVNDKRNEEIIIDDNNHNHNNQTILNSTRYTSKNGQPERNNKNILILNSTNINTINSQEKPAFLRKTNIQNIQFNSYVNNENIDTIQPLPPSRDSTFYIQTNKNLRNHSSLTNENISNSYDRHTLNASALETTDKLNNYLKIQQLKSGNSSSSNKTNFPSSNSRLGSGSRKQYPIQKKSYQQRYQQNNDNKTILDTIHDNKNIVVHGAAVMKPVNHHNDINNNRIHHDNTRVLNSFVEEDKSAANDLEDDDDYYDASVSVGLPHNHNFVDNDNFDENNSMSNAMIPHRYDNMGTSKKLPPIESILTTKNFRISSANNSKQYREKNDRPMTTTATRNEPSAIKRAPTPLTQVNSNTTTSLINSNRNSLLANNIQITGIRFTNDETSSIVSGTTINALSNIPLNNSYTKIVPVQSSQSRKNSLQNSRIHNNKQNY